MLYLRDDARNVQALGAYMQEERPEGMRDMLLSLRTSYQLVRDMAVQLCQRRRQKGRAPEKSTRALRCRKHEDIYRVSQEEKREGEREGDQRSESPEKKEVGTQAGTTI